MRLLLGSFLGLVLGLYFSKYWHISSDFTSNLLDIYWQFINDLRWFAHGDNVVGIPLLMKVKPTMGTERTCTQ